MFEGWDVGHGGVISPGAAYGCSLKIKGKSLLSLLFCFTVSFLILAWIPSSTAPRTTQEIWTTRRRRSCLCCGSWNRPIRCKPFIDVTSDPFTSRFGPRQMSVWRLSRFSSSSASLHSFEVDGSETKRVYVFVLGACSWKQGSCQ